MRILREVAHKGIYFFIILAITACTTTSNIHRYRGKGMSDTLKGSYMDIYEAAKEAAIMHGLSIKEENQTQNYLILGHGISLMSYGEIIAVYFKPNASDTETTVEVVSKPRVQTNIFSPKWQQKYLATVRNTVRPAR